MDITKTTQQATVSVRSLIERLKTVDNDLLVIFEIIDENGDLVEGHTIDSVQKKGGFYILQSQVRSDNPKRKEK